MKREFLGFPISSIRIRCARLYSLRVDKKRVQLSRKWLFFQLFPPNHIIFITVCINTRKVLFLRFGRLEVTGNLVSTRKLCTFSNLSVQRSLTSSSIFVCRICLEIYLDENHNLLAAKCVFSSIKTDWWSIIFRTIFFISPINTGQQIRNYTISFCVHLQTWHDGSLWRTNAWNKIWTQLIWVCSHKSCSKL